jgi:hypothetical protein
MTAPSGWGRLHRGRRPKASREGTAGDRRGCRALYGDLSVLAGADDGGDSAADVTLAIEHRAAAEIRSDFWACNDGAR